VNQELRRRHGIRHGTPSTPHVGPAGDDEEFAFCFEERQLEDVIDSVSGHASLCKDAARNFLQAIRCLFSSEQLAAMASFGKRLSVDLVHGHALQARDCSQSVAITGLFTLVLEHAN
jgi:hypothetical protein